MKKLLALLAAASSLAACAGSPLLNDSELSALPEPPAQYSPGISESEETAPAPSVLPPPEEGFVEEETPAPDENEERRARYMAYLDQRGYAPFLDDEGDICFQNENKTYFVIINDNDSSITTVLYPNIVSVASEQERILVADVISYVNRTAKIAKTYINSSDWVSIGLELILKNPQDFEALFERILHLMRYAENEFITQLQDKLSTQ